jgi:hypothetical protein
MMHYRHPLLANRLKTASTGVTVIHFIDCRLTAKKRANRVNSIQVHVESFGLGHTHGCHSMFCKIARHSLPVDHRQTRQGGSDLTALISIEP